MAPTICLEKKQLRASNMKVAKRRYNMVTLSNSRTQNSSTQSNVIPNFVGKHSTNLSARQRRSGKTLRTSLHKRVTQISGIGLSSSMCTEGVNEVDVNLKREQSAYHSLPSQHDDRNTGELVHCVEHGACAGVPSIKSVLKSTMSNNKSTTITAQQNVLYDNDDDDVDSGCDFSTAKCAEPWQPQADGLLSIAIKTVKLVQRNKILQKRLAQLQLETSEFIASVLANPENQHLRPKVQPKSSVLDKLSSNMLLWH